MNNLSPEKPGWPGIKKEILAFIGITFVLTYAYNLWLYLSFGSIDKLPPYSTLVQMLIPAAVAVFCAFIFRDRTLTRSSMLFFIIFYINIAIFLWEMLIGPVIPESLFSLPIYRFLPTLSILVSSASVIVLIALNLMKKSREELYPSGLSVGRNLKWYVIISVLFTILFFSVYYLNYLFGYGAAYLGYSLEGFLAGLGENLVIGFFVGWSFYFGEEYGWRIYLQDRLFTLFGGIKGVILLGVIWGLWHSGLILMGMNYPDQPILGNTVMICFTVFMGIIYSIAVLKTGSVWIAVILHLITDTMEPLAWLHISFPSDTIYCFGTGIYGIAIIGIVALALLRFDIWNQVRDLISERLSTTGGQ